MFHKVKDKLADLLLVIWILRHYSIDHLLAELLVTRLDRWLSTDVIIALEQLRCLAASRQEELVVRQYLSQVVDWQIDYHACDFWSICITNY